MLKVLCSAIVLGNALLLYSPLLKAGPFTLAPSSAQEAACDPLSEEISVCTPKLTAAALYKSFAIHPATAHITPLTHDINFLVNKANRFAPLATPDTFVHRFVSPLGGDASLLDICGLKNLKKRIEIADRLLSSPSNMSSAVLGDVALATLMCTTNGSHIDRSFAHLVSTKNYYDLAFMVVASDNLDFRTQAFVELQDTFARPNMPFEEREALFEALGIVAAASPDPTFAGFAYRAILKDPPSEGLLSFLKTTQRLDRICYAFPYFLHRATSISEVMEILTYQQSCPKIIEFLIEYLVSPPAIGRFHALLKSRFDLKTLPSTPEDVHDLLTEYLLLAPTQILSPKKEEVTKPR